MATEDGSPSRRAEKKLRKHEKNGKKRKRESREGATRDPEGPSTNGSVIHEKDDKGKSGKPSQEEPNTQNVTVTPPPSFLPSPEKQRQNPFALPVIKSPSLAAPSVTNASLEMPVTPPPKPSSLSISVKKVVQFKEDGSSDDSDYSPRAKRKRLPPMSSPRHSQSPKGLPASPKKVSTREKLLNRRRELEEERKKLPIWSGILLLLTR
jgi:hypothetical protein